VLSGYCQRKMTLLWLRRRQQAQKFDGSSQSRQRRQVRGGSEEDQCLGRPEFSVQKGWQKRRVGFRTMCAQRLDKPLLDAAFAGHPPSRHQQQRGAARAEFWPGSEDGRGDLDDICWQSSMSHRIFRDKLKQRGIAEVVATLEQNVLPNQTGILREEARQFRHIPRIDQIHCAPEDWVFNPFVMRSFQRIALPRPFNVALEPCPTCKAVFTRNRQLRIAEAQISREDLLVSRLAKLRLKFAKPLRGAGLSLGVFPKKIFRLVFEMVETRIFREKLRWHGELPFVCPRSA